MRGKASCRCRTCGREFTATAARLSRGNVSAWESWAAGHIDECQDCRRARIRAEQQARGEKAAAAALEMGLPPIIGTARRRALAETIRAEFMEQWDKFQVLHGHGGRARVPEGLRAWILSKDGAAFWIENHCYLTMPPPAAWKIFKDDYMEDRGRQE